jgi:hypothetical protein
MPHPNVVTTLWMVPVHPLESASSASQPREPRGKTQANPLQDASQSIASMDIDLLVLLVKMTSTEQVKASRDRPTMAGRLLAKLFTKTGEHADLSLQHARKKSPLFSIHRSAPKGKPMKSGGATKLSASALDDWDDG